MTTDKEVRAWAKGVGIDVPTRGKLAEDIRELYEQAHADPADDTDPPAMPGEEQPPSMPPAAEEWETWETPPTPPPSKLESFKARVSGGAGPRKRVSLEDVASAGWSAMAALLGSQGFKPTSRILALQAPVAGVILEDALKGTIVDRVLQPLARGGDTAKEIAALVGPPVLVSVLTAQPGLAPQLLPVLKGSLRSWMTIAGPKIKAKQRAEAKLIKDLGLEGVDDLDGMLDEMIQAIFAPDPEAYPEPDTAMPHAA